MQKPIALFSILIAAVLLALVACAPGTRESTPTPKITVPPHSDPNDAAQDEDKSLKVGDIIFHKSKSRQSKAIKEASQSEWTHVGILILKNDKWHVAEAIGPVVATKLEDFIKRGHNRDYKILRFKHFDPATMEDALLAAIKKQNKAYDIYFEISDESTYCSELVYKVMLEVTGHELGKLQQYKDLKLNGPQVQALIKRRLTDKGRTLDPEEPIVTPASQLLDPQMTLIRESVQD